MSRLTADHPWVTVRRPDGERRISVPPPMGFFPPITPQIPTGRRAAAGRQPGGALRSPEEPRRSLADGLIAPDIGRSSGKF